MHPLGKRDHMIITRPSSSYSNLITDDLERGGEGGERDIIGTAPTQEKQPLETVLYVHRIVIVPIRAYTEATMFKLLDKTILISRTYISRHF